MAAAEFFKFAGILCTALSQHHLLEFEIACLLIVIIKELINCDNQIFFLAIPRSPEIAKNWQKHSRSVLSTEKVLSKDMINKMFYLCTSQGDSVSDRICSLRIWSEEKLSKIMPK